MQPHPFYKGRAWQHARRQALHDANYRCVRCDTTLVGKGRAAHVHHRKAYAKAPALGIEPLNLQPLCRSCHNAAHAELKRPRARCDEDGRPIDQDHPWFVSL